MNQNDLVSVEAPIEEQNGHMNGQSNEEVSPDVEVPIVEQTPLDSINNGQKEEIQTTGNIFQLVLVIYFIKFFI